MTTESSTTSTTASTTAATLRPRDAAARIGLVARRYPIVQGLIFVLLCAYAYHTIPGIGTRTSIDINLILAAFLGLVALGQTLVILMGGIDFSVAGFILLGATVCCELAGGEHWPLPTVLVVVGGLGAAGGAVSGAICHIWKVQPLIVTLAVGTIVTGFMLVWLGGVQPPPAPASLARFTAPTSTTLGLPIPPVVTLWAVVIVMIGVVSGRTSLGRRIYLFGSNARAAELTLVPIARLRIGGFAFSAMSSALVGTLLAGFSGTADPAVGNPYLFQSLTAVIAGGTAFGARGGYTRTVLGALTLVALSTILVGKGYNSADQQIVYGVLILVAVFAYGRTRRLADRV